MVLHIGASYRQETVCGGFPIVVLHIGASCRQETIGKWFPMEVKHSGASYQQETIRPEISGLCFAALEMTMKGTRHSVISSGAACRNGSSGIGTIETLSREISRLHAFYAIAERVQGFPPSK